MSSFVADPVPLEELGDVVKAIDFSAECAASPTHTTVAVAAAAVESHTSLTQDLQTLLVQQQQTEAAQPAQLVTTAQTETAQVGVIGVGSMSLPSMPSLATAGADDDDDDEELAMFPSFAAAASNAINHPATEHKQTAALAAAEALLGKQASRKRKSREEEVATASAAGRSRSRSRSCSRSSSRADSRAASRSASRSASRTGSRASSRRTSPTRAHSAAAEPSPAARRRSFSLTRPVSPKLATALRASHHSEDCALSTEELALRKVEQERRALRALAQQNKQTLQYALHAHSSADVLPARSTRPLTQPVEMHFRTAERSRTPTCEMSEEMKVKEEKPLPFVAGALTHPQPFTFATETRAAATAHVHTAAATAAAVSAQSSRPSSPAQLAKKIASMKEGGITQPLPFTFETDKRVADSHPAATATTPAEPFVSLANLVSRVLDRDHVLPAPAAAAATPACGGVTQPQPFHLQTADRERKTSVLSTEERILQEAAAHRVGGASVSAPAASAGPRPASSFRAPTLTQLQPFHVANAATVASTAAAARVDKDELERQQVVAEREEKRRKLLARAKDEATGLTVAQPPRLCTEERGAADAPLAAAAATVVPAFKARPMPVYDSCAPLPAKEQRALTTPAPFQLATEERSQHKQLTPAAATAPTFKARPMPVFEEIHRKAAAPEATAAAATGAPSRKPLTELKPFDLQSAKKHADAVAHFQQCVAAAERERVDKTNFKARPLPSTTYEAENVSAPPQAAHLSVTEAQPFELASARRATERADFEAQLQERQRVQAQQAAVVEAQRHVEEQLALQRYRQTLVHHPTPVPHTNTHTHTHNHAHAHALPR